MAAPSRRPFSRVVEERIKTALDECEKTVLGEFEEDTIVHGWIRRMRQNIEANCGGVAPVATTKQASLANEIAASRARTGLVGARSRRTAAQIVEWRLEASQRLAEDMRKLAPGAKRMREEQRDEVVADSRVDLARYATKLNSAAKTVLYTAEDAPPRIRQLRKLVETVQKQDSRRSATTKRRRTSPSKPRDPTDLVATHLAQTNSLADFISLPEHRRTS